jgi:hypothetical protein
MKLETPEVALALGPYRMSDAAIHARLRKLAASYKGPALSAHELREALDREMGERSLTEELHRLRDGE